MTPTSTPKKVGIDASCWLHRGAYGCATDLCVPGRSSDKFVDYFMHHIRMMQHARVSPYVVFDGAPSRGRVCHQVLIIIHLNVLNTAMIVCFFEHVQWRWALNDRLAPRLGAPLPMKRETNLKVVEQRGLSLVGCVAAVWWC
jgi:hypothetical protein